MAIGLSASFVEPLEASSIGTSIQQSFLLMYRLINYDQKVIDSYNKDCNSILENIRDFVALHYYTNKDSSPFWKDLKSIEVPDKLRERLEIWKNRLPVSEDFNSDHHIMVLHGIDHFNTNSIKKEFDMHHIGLKIESDNIISSNKLQHDTVPRISHKEFIKYFR